MVEKMMEIRRVLKNAGSVFLHCDNEANDYPRRMMDAAFGQDNFRNEIVWKRATSRKIDASRFCNTRDTILFYSKSSHTRTTRSDCATPPNTYPKRTGMTMKTDEGATL